MTLFAVYFSKKLKFWNTILENKIVVKKSILLLGCKENHSFYLFFYENVVLHLTSIKQAFCVIF